MSLIISFDKTAPALIVDRKHVTRRNWKANHVKKFKAGEVVQGWDHQPRTRIGTQLVWIRLTEAPYLEPVREMPDSDYEEEGFAYLYAHPELLPSAELRVNYSWDAFNQWRDSLATLYVVRFTLEEVVV